MRWDNEIISSFSIQPFLDVNLKVLTRVGRDRTHFSKTVSPLSLLSPAKRVVKIFLSSHTAGDQFGTQKNDAGPSDLSRGGRIQYPRRSHRWDSAGGLSV
jgi:hypothetical protein